MSQELKLRIGIAQIENSIDLDANLARILASLERLKSLGADFALFPECALTGFSAKVDGHDYVRVATAFERIRKRLVTLRLAAWVPSAWKTERGELLNAGYLFQPGLEPRLFTKEGLTDSERGFFTAGAGQSRIIEFRGFRLGLLICMEAAESAWTYFSPDARPDAILWPGYWGWGESVEWNESLEKLGRVVFVNAREWERPIIQANFARNAFDHKSGPTGLSVHVDAQNRLLRTGALAKEDHSIVEVTRR